MSGAPLVASDSFNSPPSTTASSFTAPAPFKPNYSNFSMSTPTASLMNKPQPAATQAQAPSYSSAPKAQTATKPIDPFAALTSPLRKSTPQPPSATKSMFDFGNPAPPKSAASTDDDEWNFSSATLPEADTILITNTMVKVDLKPSRSSASDPVINLETTFSNNTATPVSELTFQVAVTKVFLVVDL